MKTVVAALLLAVTAATAVADDIDDAGFGPRISGAISRFPRFADVAATLASAGSRYSSGNNPAGIGFNPAVGESGFGTSVQYAGLYTEEGTKVHVGSLSLVIDAGDWGAFQPSLLVLDSNRATMRDGLDFEWEGWSAEIQWGRKIDERTAIGLNLSVLSSEMNFHLDSIHVSRAKSETYQIRFGVLHAFTERFYGGVTLECALAPSRTKVFDFMGLGIGTQREDDTGSQVIFRPGIYTFLTDDLTLYADYQFAGFDDDTGQLTVHRFYVGADQTVTEGLYLRAGVVADTEGNVSFAAGVGIAPSETLYVDIAYQYDMYPELDQEFGRADLFGIGVTWLF